MRARTKAGPGKWSEQSPLGIQISLKINVNINLDLPKYNVNVLIILITTKFYLFFEIYFLSDPVTEGTTTPPTSNY